MGLDIGGTIKGVGKSIGTGIKNIGKSMVGVRYRTGVVNDFSIVTKAVFHVLESNGSGTYTVTDSLPVQINPSTYTRETQTNPSQIKGLKDMKTVVSDKCGSGDYKTDVVLDLVYSLFDEYNIETSDGLASGIGPDGSFLNLSLENKTITSLPKLRDLCGTGTLVVFKWGQTQLFGTISNVRCEYTAFSRWGEPLECRANVTLSLEPLNSPVYTSKIQNDLLKDIKTYEETSNIANTAILGFTQALR